MIKVSVPHLALLVVLFNVDVHTLVTMLLDIFIEENQLYFLAAAQAIEQEKKEEK